MKKFLVFPAVIALATLGSCQKQQTEAEKNAEVERQVLTHMREEYTRATAPFLSGLGCPNRAATVKERLVDWPSSCRFYALAACMAGTSTQL